MGRDQEDLSEVERRQRLFALPETPWPVVTELVVHQVADEVVASGERPTVERIRAHLGTGSPSTVTLHLDAWWSRARARLHQRAPDQGHPNVPATVDALAQRCWAALDATGQQAQTVLAGKRAALAAAVQWAATANAAAAWFRWRCDPCRV